MHRQSLENKIFADIRRFSKFCSVCGKPLDLENLQKFGRYDWHYPWCLKCREKLFRKITDEGLKYP